MVSEYRPNTSGVRHKTMQTLINHITLEANGCKCTTQMVLDVVPKASAGQSSVEAVCAHLEEVAGSNTIRECLNNAPDTTSCVSKKER